MSPFPKYVLQSNEKAHERENCEIRIIEEHSQTENQDEIKSYVAHLLDVTKYDQVSKKKRVRNK